MFVQVKDFPNYLVDENGVVVSLFRGKWRILKQSLNHKGPKGYFIIQLGAKNYRLVHRLVIEVFYGSSEFNVNHKNGIKTDNRLENLEYCTAKENTQHAWDIGLCESIRDKAKQTGLASFGEKNGMSKISDITAAQILAHRNTGVTQRATASIFGVSREHVRDIWSGRRRKHLQKVAI
jgi:hypothetical protein